MKEFSRAERLGEVLQRELALLLQREIKDPRLQLVTITQVKVSPDLSVAKVYVTHLEDTEKNTIIKILKKAAPHLRYGLAHQLKLRITPELHFFYDPFPQQSAHLSALIDQAVKEDEKKKQ